MVFSILTTLFFALSAVFATRTTRIIGSINANFYRLIVSAFVLGAWAHTIGFGLHGKSMPYFFASGLVGFGLGDLALYQAFPRLGARLSVLLTQCLAVPIGTCIEWIWLDTRLSSQQIIFVTIILFGIWLALHPTSYTHTQNSKKSFFSGIIFGTLAAFGQAGGAVLSRKAYSVASIAQEHIDGPTAAYQRVIAGLVIALIPYLIHKLHHKQTGVYQINLQKNLNTSTFLLIAGNALAGPVIGVSCYQQALSAAPTGIVLPVVATTPLVVIPFSNWLEGERPGLISLIGCLVAVSGVIFLLLSA